MLTLSQRKTYEFIKAFIKKYDYSPSTSEIAAGIGIKSRGVVHRYLKALEASGKIELQPHRHRNIILVEQAKQFTQAMLSSLPLLGVIAAGSPIEAIEQQDSIDIATIFLGENRYALKVKGDSMIEEGIHDGDIVVCEQAATARNGQIVVALIDDREATLKRFQRNTDNTITLFPANTTLQPTRYDAIRVAVQGIYVGLLRFNQ